MRPNGRGLATVAALGALAFCVVACVTETPDSAARHRWWARLGPVLPHDTFPTDCKLCHVGEKWDVLRSDFTFDHEAQAGVPLRGAHAEAQCLRCHNDRGPVAIFEAKGCVGCHEDVHQADLGRTCEKCHVETTWEPVGQIALHDKTRFPLVGAHVSTACWRCHPGAEVGQFVPTDTDCATCHQGDLARTTNHVGLGWVNRCDRCHIPTRWEQAEVD